jgi:uncharacterized protein (DUF952 family)
MAWIYHLVSRPLWQQSGTDYRADSLASEGFIHCSFAEQVADTANRFYGGATDLLVLHIDAARLGSALKVEPATTGELYPHVYGPIPRAAVVQVGQLQRGPDGRWVFVP